MDAQLARHLALRTGLVFHTRGEGNMAQGYIPVDYASLEHYYPRRLEKTGEFGGKLAVKELRDFMASIPGTPCCVQVSHSLNMSGLQIPRKFPGSRRANSPITLKNGSTYFYILAVDEMETYLTSTYGEGELVRSDFNKDLRLTADKVKDSIRGRNGILVMRDATPGVHTELWDGSSFHQKDMRVDALLTKPRVLFWPCTFGPPRPFTD